MITLVTGGRDWTDAELIATALASAAPPCTAVVEGECRGADRLARTAAERLGIPVDPRPADWQRYRGGAGPVRNQEMADLAPDRCFAFHDDLSASRGTADMVRRCRAAQIPVCLFTHDQPEGRWL